VNIDPQGQCLRAFVCDSGNTTEAVLSSCPDYLGRGSELEGTGLIRQDAVYVYRSKGHIDRATANHPVTEGDQVFACDMRDCTYTADIQVATHQLDTDGASGL